MVVSLVDNSKYHQKRKRSLKRLWIWRSFRNLSMLWHQLHLIDRTEMGSYQVNVGEELNPVSMDPEAYLPKPYKEPRMGCCQNMTCCSVFCLLISVAFVVAGAVLMIYAKVAKGNCDQAASGHSSVQSVCNTVLYDGLFYGGIVVMAISGLVTLWRLMMCMCGHRR
jgi:hypothetical protein